MIVIGKDGKLEQVREKELRQIENNIAKITSEDNILISPSMENLVS